MLNTIFWGYWHGWDDNPELGFFGTRKCAFDGVNRLIIVSDSTTQLDIKQDVYSDWKEWVLTLDNTKFPAAIRTTGGDPISGTSQFTGDIYFLINGWRLMYDPRQTAVTGVLYSDDYDTAYYLKPTLEPLYPARVSSIVNTFQLNSSTSAAVSAQQVWEYANRTLTATNSPSASEIRQEIDANSTKLQSINNDLQIMLNTMSPEDLWNFLLSNPLAQGSAGEKLKQVLTTSNYLAFK